MHANAFNATHRIHACCLQARHEKTAQVANLRQILALKQIQRAVRKHSIQASQGFQSFTIQPSVLESWECSVHGIQALVDFDGQLGAFVKAAMAPEHTRQVCRLVLDLRKIVQESE